MGSESIGWKGRMEREIGNVAGLEGGTIRERNDDAWSGNSEIIAGCIGGVEMARAATVKDGRDRWGQVGWELGRLRGGG